MTLKTEADFTDQVFAEMKKIDPSWSTSSDTALLSAHDDVYSLLRHLQDVPKLYVALGLDLPVSLENGESPQMLGAKLYQRYLNGLTAHLLANPIDLSAINSTITNIAAAVSGLTADSKAAKSSLASLASDNAATSKSLTTLTSDNATAVHNLSTLDAEHKKIEGVTVYLVREFDATTRALHSYSVEIAGIQTTIAAFTTELAQLKADIKKIDPSKGHTGPSVESLQAQINDIINTQDNVIGKQARSPNDTKEGEK